MRIFPGVDTAKERKRFVIFHSFTFILCPIISILIIRLINGSWSYNNDKHSWMIGSILIWNYLGSWRFFSDANKEGFWEGRFTATVFLICFPLFYLYNLWRVFFKNEDDMT